MQKTREPLIGIAYLAYYLLFKYPMCWEEFGLAPEKDFERFEENWRGKYEKTKRIFVD